MGKILAIFLICLFCITLWSLPIYVCVNFVLWVFHISYHLTIFQAFAIGILACLIRNLLFKNSKED